MGNRKLYTISRSAQKQQHASSSAYQRSCYLAWLVRALPLRMPIQVGPCSRLLSEGGNVLFSADRLRQNAAKCFKWGVGAADIKLLHFPDLSIFLCCLSILPRPTVCDDSVLPTGRRRLGEQVRPCRALELWVSICLTDLGSSVRACLILPSLSALGDTFPTPFQAEWA